MKMSSSDEVKLRACMLDLLCFLHSVCEKYDIPYYITSGTLLGAVRHKGFIPWDDDIDVALLRKDYNRFYQVVRKELGDKYAIQEMPSRNNLALKDSVFRLFANGQETMVMIDTFPIDNVPSPFTRFLSIQTRTAMCFFRFAQICGWDHKRSALRVLGRLCRHLGILVEQAFNFLETQWVHYFTWDTPNRFPDGRYAVYDKCLIGCRVLLEFEGHLFYGPERYDECLRQMYGDYMMLPPVEARVPPHAISELKFPKGSGTY